MACWQNSLRAVCSLHSFTLVEGWTVAEIVAALKKVSCAEARR